MLSSGLHTQALACDWSTTIAGQVSLVVALSVTNVPACDM